MAPNVAQFFAKKKAAPRPPLVECAMNKTARGAAVFTDDHVEAMAAGNDVKLPKDLDDIVVDVNDDKSEKGIDWESVLKPVPKEVIAADEEVRTYHDAIEKACCPKYSNNPFKFFEDATWHSDGLEVKHFNISCQGTESSPCSYCSDDEKPGYKTPSPTPKVKRTEFAQAKGFNLSDFEGEEETPEKKVSYGPDVCKWCHRDPCLVDDEEVRAEGKVVVDNLNAQAAAGTELQLNNYRFALYRMYARVLGFTGKRYLLPVCVQAYVDKYFVAKDETRTGFKAHK